MNAVFASGGTGAVNAVLLASAIVPPIVVIFVSRLAWVWAKSQDAPEPASFADLLRRAVWLGPRKAARS